MKYSMAIVAVFLWIGFVCAISFLEAWLKFKAPGITVQLGLGIGRLVFSALNKVELVLALAVVVNLLLGNKELFSMQNWLFFLPLGLLILQTFWLLPALDARALNAINNVDLPKTTLHLYYVGFEIIKVISLFFFGIRLLNS